MTGQVEAKTPDLETQIHYFTLPQTMSDFDMNIQFYSAFYDCKKVGKKKKKKLKCTPGA